MEDNLSGIWCIWVLQCFVPNITPDAQPAVLQVVLLIELAIAMDVYLILSILVTGRPSLLLSIIVIYIVQMHLEIATKARVLSILFSICYGFILNYRHKIVENAESKNRT